MENSVTLGDLYNLINTVNSRICTKIDDIKTDLNNLSDKFNKQITAVETKIDSLETENKELKRRLYSVEKVIKRKNLLIYGLPEADNENTVEIVVDVVKNKLDINLKSTEIANCFRLGKKIDKKHRPILLVLISNLKRSELLTNKGKLKGTNIFINEDLTQEDSNRRRTLVNKLKEARAHNRNATLKGNRLMVDGVSYTAEDFDICTDITDKDQEEKSQISPSSVLTTKIGKAYEVQKQIGVAENFVKGQEQESQIFTESEKKRKLQDLSSFPSTAAKRGSPYSTRSNAIASGSSGKK